MGNCLKKNKVEPLDVRDKPNKKLNPRSPSERPGSVEQAEMVKGLQDEGKEAHVAGGGVSFVVDFKEGKTAKKPSLIDKKGRDEKEVHTGEDLPTYSVEEKTLMADILRESQLKERSEKAASVDMKLYDAKRRRMLRDAEAEAIRKERETVGNQEADEDENNSVTSDGAVASEI